jgi:hypothetical protein
MSTERLRRISFKGKEIIYADYSNCKEAEMISITQQHRDLILEEKTESLFVANYVGTYGTPAYMKAAQDFTLQTKPYVKRGAFLGITGPKVFLLKGIIFFLDVNFKAFDTEAEALEFLIAD